MKPSKGLTQQAGAVGSCPLYLTLSADGENAHIRWLGSQRDDNMRHVLIVLLLDPHDNDTHYTGT